MGTHSIRVYIWPLLFKGPFALKVLRTLVQGPGGQVSEANALAAASEEHGRRCGAT